MLTYLRDAEQKQYFERLSSSSDKICCEHGVQVHITHIYMQNSHWLLVLLHRLDESAKKNCSWKTVLGVDSVINRITQFLMNIYSNSVVHHTEALYVNDTILSHIE